MYDAKDRMGLERTTSPQTCVQHQDGQIWLDRKKLANHDKHVIFEGLDGIRTVDWPRPFDVFTWDGKQYEVWGYSKSRKAWWIGEYKPPPDEGGAAGKKEDPRGL